MTGRAASAVLRIAATPVTRHYVDGHATAAT